MLRVIGGVVVGYIVMFVVVFVALTVAYQLMGADVAFRPGSYQASGLWVATMLLVGFVAAVAGGLVCAVIAKRRSAKIALIGVVLVLGLLSAIPAFTHAGEEAPARPSNVAMMEAMQNAREPVWLALLNPILGAVGVCLGAGLRSREE